MTDSGRRPQRGPAMRPTEYADRLAAVRERMARRSLTALVVTDPANIHYLAGYDAWTFYMPQCLVVPAAAPPVLFVRAMDVPGAHRTATALSADQVAGYPEDLVHRPDVHPFNWLAEQIVDRGLIAPDGTDPVAVEADSHYFTMRAYVALHTSLPQVPLVDSAELVNWVRVVKSPAELDLMRIAGDIAERVMRAALDAVEPGRRQCDVVAEILAAQARGTTDHGGDYPAIVPLLPTGEAADIPHLTWRDDVFNDGTAVSFELAGVYRRYHVPIARTIMLGEPSSRLRSTADVVRDGMAAALATLRPGRTAHEVHAAWDAVISAEGLSKDSRIGYSIGLGYPPDWGEHTVSIRRGEDVVLESGMCLHVLLGMWEDGFGYELSESVVVTGSGVERLTHLPQDLATRR